MNGDKVSFDSQGGYVIGQGVKEMNVHPEASEEVNISAVLGSQRVVKPQPMTTSNSGGRKPFSLEALRQKAAAPAPAPQPAVAEERKPEIKLTPEKPQVEVAVEPKPEPVPEDIPDEAPVSQGQHAEDAPLPPVESVGVAIEEEAVTPNPTPIEKPNFSLTQLGLAKQAEEPVVDEDKEPEEGVKTMNIVEEKKVPEVIEPAPAPVVTPVKSGPVEQFEVMRTPDLLRTTGATESSIIDWVSAVVKACVGKPTAIFECASHRGLRIYSVFQPSPRSTNVYVAMGVDKKITVCSFNQRRRELADCSGEITLSGSCAIVLGMPVASCSQRNNAATLL